MTSMPSRSTHWWTPHTSNARVASAGGFDKDTGVIDGSTTGPGVAVVAPARSVAAASGLGDDAIAASEADCRSVGAERRSGRTGARQPAQQPMATTTANVARARTGATTYG